MVPNIALMRSLAHQRTYQIETRMFPSHSQVPELLNCVLDSTLTPPPWVIILLPLFFASLLGLQK